MDFLIKFAKSEAGKQVINAVGQQVTEAVRRTVESSTEQSASVSITKDSEEQAKLTLESIIDSEDKARSPQLMWPQPVDATQHYKVHTIVSPIFSIAEYADGHALIHRPTSTIVYYNDNAARIDDLNLLWSAFGEELRKMENPLPVIHDLVLLILNDKEKNMECKPVYFAILTSMYEYCTKVRDAEGKKFSMTPINKFGDTPVHVAAESGDVKMLRLLWDSNFTPCTQNFDGRTVYMCDRNNESIKDFINKKVTPEQMNELVYMKAFSNAAYSDSNSTEALRVKFDKQRKSEYLRLSLTKFLEVLKTGKFSAEDVEKVLAAGCNQNPIFLGEIVNGKNIFHDFSNVPVQYQKTLLKFATREMLNMRDSQGQSPAHHIAKNGTLNAFILLWSHGADINGKDKKGFYPMDYALVRDHAAIVKAFLVFDGLTNEEVYKKILSPASNKNAVKKLLLEHNDLYSTHMSKAVNYNFNIPTHRRCRNFDNLTEHDLIALSIDGGGMKGVIALQVLKEIEKIKGGDFLSWFNMIGGTSTGSIIALGLTKYNNSDQVMRTYFRLKDEIFAGSRPYSGEELERALLDEFGDVPLGKLSEEKNIRLAIPVARVDVTPPVLCMFRSYKFETPNDSELPEWTAAKVVRASCAAPSFFPPVDQKFMDGGLIANNPTLDILSDCQRLAFESNRQVKPKIMVSIGTGSSTKKCDSVEIVKPTTVSGVVNTFNQLLHLKDVFIDQLTASDATVERAKWMAEAMEMAYFRFSPTLDVPVAIDEKENISLIDALLSVMYKSVRMRNDMLMLASILA